MNYHMKAQLCSYIHGCVTSSPSWSSGVKIGLEGALLPYTHAALMSVSCCILQTSTFRSGEADIALLQGNHLLLRAGSILLVSAKQ